MAINIYQKIQTLKYAIKQKNVELNYYINMQQQLEGHLTVQEIIDQKLTPHQLKVMELVQHSMTNAQIANVLQISPKTVKYHLTHIFAYLNCDNRHELKTLLDGINYESKTIKRIPTGPANGSTQAIIGRLSSGPETGSSGVSLPFGAFK